MIVIMHATEIAWSWDCALIYTAQSQDCTNVEHNFKIGMQFSDSENAQHNLEIA